MAEVQLEMIGLRPFRRRVAAGAKKIRPTLEESLEKIGLKIERRAKLNIRGSRSRARRKHRAVTAKSGRLGIDSGRLRASISARNLSGLDIEIGPQGVPYAAIHELGGTIPGRFVRPRGNGVLAFPLPGGGTGFSKGHYIGARKIPKRPFLAPAVKSTEKEAFRLIGRTFDVVVV